ncbi:MAG: class I SAM-dependent methyltransferase [Pseudomonadota bacterium]|jgi:SAM-dependent methyltransferase
MLQPDSRAIRMRIAAAAGTLLMLGAIGLALRCASPARASCSISTLFGDEPQLDVPYVTTRPETIALMLEMAGVGPDDHVIDLGTGDGRILIAAARDRGARGLGVDIDPVMIRRAQANARRAGVADRVSFEVRDLFETPLGEADVVTMYLLPQVNLRLRPRLLAELKPGSRVVSHAWDMGDWEPDEVRRAGGAVVYLWRIPDRAAP